MKWFSRRILTALALTVSVASAASAGTVTGKVTNATTGKPAASAEVILIALQGGMQPVANTKTDAQGQFTFDNPAIGGGPMLIRAVYKGVNFHQPLPPGKNTADVTVYDISGDAKTVSVPSHLIIFQPNGAKLTVAEQFLVRNETKPPVAFFRADGNFQIALPEKAELKQIAASGPAGMPVSQAPIELGKDKYAFAFAFRPGDNEVRLAYEVPYAGDTATLKLAPSHGEQRVILVVPPSVTISGDQLNAAGQEQGMNLFEHTIAAGAASFSVKLSGSAPPLQDAAVAGGDAQGANGRQGGDDNQGGGVPIQVVPGRLNDLQWYLLCALVLAFAGGGYLLSRKQIIVAGGEAAAIATTGATKANKATGKAHEAPAATSLESLDQHAATSLDGLKDLIFKLELRKQAGTISDEEYAAERARAEKILRDLVRG